MKNIFWLLLFTISVPYTFAESSEDIYNLQNACSLTHWVHFGQIIWLEQDSRFKEVISDKNYNIWTFHRMYDDSWGGESIYFVVNDNWITWTQRYAELFIVNCSPQSGQTAHFLVHRKETNIQYSPEVSKITWNYIILDDWQNILGKSYHVSVVFDRETSIFYHIRNEVLLQNKFIKNFVRNSPFFWEIKSYDSGSATIEIRLNEKKKRNFTIKFK
jgi:hypothetical protein